MKFKRGFTLAEILIVLMVIGVIATMTVPTLMKGVNEAQYKTAFKKAFNAITNIAAVEKISGQLPVAASEASLLNFFASLNANLSVKEFYEAPTDVASSAQEVMTSSETTYTSVTLGDTTYGSTSEDNRLTGPTSLSADEFSPWIITEDGLAYSITYPSGGACESKATIMEQDTNSDVISQSCLIVMVDVNGLSKGPNKIETQVIGDGVDSAAKMNQLEGDRYYIFVGNDGVSAGPKSITVSGRLMSDMK